MYEWETLRGHIEAFSPCSSDANHTEVNCLYSVHHMWIKHWLQQQGAGFSVLGLRTSCLCGYQVVRSFQNTKSFFFLPCSDKLQQWLGGQLRLRWRGQATHCGGGQPAGAWGYRCWWNHIAGQPWPWRHRNSITPQRVLEWRWGTSHEACVFSTATGAFQGVFTPAVFSFFESNSGADQNNCIETFFFEDVAEDVGVAVL